MAPQTVAPSSFPIFRLPIFVQEVPFVNRSSNISATAVWSLLAGVSLLSAPAAPCWAQTASQLPAASPSTTPLAAAPSTLIQQIAERIKPTLVRIHVVEGVPSEGRESKQESFGSGVIISPDGYVVTNHHVAGKARWLSCTLASREEVSAKLIGTDPLSDIALIKLDLPKDGSPYPVAAWGASGELRVGDPVLAMGSPLAFSQSVTSGIVSNTELILPAATFGDSTMTLDGEDVGSIVRWIGHDAQILPGNSGGPLINLSGEIIGINEISVGLAGAIPGDLARAVVSQLKAAGRVTRAYTGLDLQPRFREGDTLGTGVLIGGVVAGSPAALAGVKPGDVLLTANGAALTARFREQVPLANLQLAQLPVGKPVALTLQRGGEKRSVSLTARPRDPAEAPSVEVKGWGFTASDITPTMAREARYASVDGAMVTTLLAGSPSAEAQPPLEEGDVILAVEGKKVASVKALEAITEAIAPVDGGTPTLVEVRRDGQRLLTVISVKKQASDDTSVTVPKAWLPVKVQVVTSNLAKALGLPEETKGVRVTQVFSGTAAGDASALKVGDILTRIDDIPIEASQPEDADVFSSLIRQYKIGTTAKLSVLRNAKPQTISVVLARGPKQERELARYTDDDFGMTIRSVSYEDRARRGAGPDENGALVVGVTRGSWAALAGLQGGDIIHRIAETPIADMEGAKAKLLALKKQKAETVPFFVGRGVHTRFVELKTDYGLDAPPPVAKTSRRLPTPTSKP
ncbi:MAG: PDZ domain-containing protein [Cytophagales bacterium]|nr:PDZ domain-containing protein [Armatimonadota bacterium]